MSELELQVGKSYVKISAKESPRGISSFDIAKILGTVDADTKQYSQGYRFFDDRGRFYDEAGDRRNYARRTDSPNWNERQRNNLYNFSLYREATHEDLKNGFVEKLWYSPKRLTNPSEFISCRDPRFQMQLGGVYVDRMGFAFMIDAIKHSEDPDDMRFIASKIGDFLSNGRVRNTTTSMEDVAYQRI